MIAAGAGEICVTSKYRITISFKLSSGGPLGGRRADPVLNKLKAAQMAALLFSD
jgi:hypothetical protein